MLHLVIIGFVGLLDPWIHVELLLLDVVHYLVVVLLLYPFNRILFLLFIRTCRYRLIHDLLFLVLLIKLYSQVVLLRMDLVSELSLFNYVPHKLEVVEEKQELPDQPNYEE